MMLKNKIIQNDVEVYSHYQEYVQDLNQQQLGDRLFELAHNPSGTLRLIAVPDSDTENQAEENPLENECTEFQSDSRCSDEAYDQNADPSSANEIKDSDQRMEEENKELDYVENIEEQVTLQDISADKAQQSHITVSPSLSQDIGIGFMKREIHKFNEGHEDLADHVADNLQDQDIAKQNVVEISISDDEDGERKSILEHDEEEPGNLDRLEQIIAEMDSQELADVDIENEKVSVEDRDKVTSEQDNQEQVDADIEIKENPTEDIVQVAADIDNTDQFCEDIEKQEVADDEQNQIISEIEIEDYSDLDYENQKVSDGEPSKVKSEMDNKFVADQDIEDQEVSFDVNELKDIAEFQEGADEIITYLPILEERLISLPSISELSPRLELNRIISEMDEQDIGKQDEKEGPIFNSEPTSPKADVATKVSQIISLPGSIPPSINNSFTAGTGLYSFRGRARTTHSIDNSFATERLGNTGLRSSRSVNTSFSAQTTKTRSITPIVYIQKKAKTDFRILVIGAKSSGKSALIQRMVDDDAPQNYKPTIGCAFRRKQLARGRSERAITFIEATRPFIRMHITSCDVIMIVYDSTNRSSFEEVISLQKTISNSCPVFLIATKTDSGKQQVKNSEGQDYAKDNGMYYFEFSALTGKGSLDVFEHLYHVLS